MQSDRRLSIIAVAVQLNLDRGTVRQILNDLGMKKVSVKMVPWLLTNCQAVSGPKIGYWNGTPTYSPNLAPNDVWQFPEIKSTLKGPRFQDTKDVQKMWRRHWKLFQKCFQRWQHCRAKCIAAEGGYSEGNSSQYAASTRELYSHTSYCIKPRLLIQRLVNLTKTRCDIQIQVTRDSWRLIHYQMCG
jgi:hypothetical protein